MYTNGYTIARKNGYTLRPETASGARAVLTKMFACHAKEVSVVTPDGAEYRVTLVKGKEQWWKKTAPIVVTEVVVDENVDDYNLQYACGGSMTDSEKEMVELEVMKFMLEEKEGK